MFSVNAASCLPIPAEVVVSLYGPGITAGNRNNPTSLVRVVVVTFVTVFVSVISALGMTAPLWSRTVPLTDPVLACGHALNAKNSAKIAERSALCIQKPPKLRVYGEYTPGAGENALEKRVSGCVSRTETGIAGKKRDPEGYAGLSGARIAD
jgi:hypothetical protein